VPAVVRPSRMPSKGKSATGSKDVIGIGMASVIHHPAINIATATMRVTSGCPGARSAKSNTSSANTGIKICASSLFTL